MNVSLFITCLGDHFYPNAGRATVELLERFDCDVDFPATQTCCGQPAFNSGYHKDAKKGGKADHHRLSRIGIRRHAFWLMCSHAP